MTLWQFILGIGCYTAQLYNTQIVQCMGQASEYIHK